MVLDRFAMPVSDYFFLIREIQREAEREKDRGGRESSWSKNGEIVVDGRLVQKSKKGSQI